MFRKKQNTEVTDRDKGTTWWSNCQNTVFTDIEAKYTEQEGK